MNYTYILFDLDGTLTESGPGIMNSVSYALEKLGKPSQPTEVLRKFVGPPLAHSFVHFCGFAKEEVPVAIETYREYYRKKGMFENSVYPGIAEMLQCLKDAGLHLAVATSKPEVLSLQILEHFDLKPYFEVICGATMDEKRVKKGEIIADAMKGFGITETDKSRVLMVGDREHDVLGAKENGIASMGVLFGYGNRKELETTGADYIAESAADITKQILSFL